VIGAYLIYSFFLVKDIKRLLQTLFPLILGLGLSAVYIVPVVFERKFVQIDYIVNCHVGNYKNNFLFTLDKVQTGLRNFYLPVHIGVVLEVLLFCFIVMIMQKNRQIFSKRPMFNFFTFLFLFAFFLTTPISRPVWDIVPGFPFLQFPWRWIPMMEFSLCFLIAYIFSSDGMSILRFTILKRAVIYLLIILSLVSFVTIIKSRVIPDTSLNKSLNLEEIGRLLDPPLEYTPIGVKNIEAIMSETRNKKASVLSGIARSRIEVWQSQKRVINIEASTSSLLRISTFYYPGWEAKIDGIKTPIKTEKESGAMLINISEGKHTLELRFVDTPIRYYSKLISLASLFIVVFLFLRPQRNGSKSKRDRNE
jgi:hypothetical protein